MLTSFNTKLSSNTKNLISLALCLFFITITLLPIFVDALGPKGPIIPPCGQKDVTGKLAPECGFDDLITLINNIINTLIWLAVPVATAVFAWAGITMLMHPTNPGKRTEAINMMKNVGIGLVVILSAWIVTTTLTKVLFTDKVPILINP
ncbi:MAG: pilin [Patescibacteria group bacterium]